MHLFFDDQSAMSKALSNFVIKLVIGVAIFFLPTILSAMIGLINGSDDVKDEYSVCSKCLLDYCSCLEYIVKIQNHIMGKLQK